MSASTRILTRAAALTGNRNAAVDIQDDTRRYYARCQPCGWTRDHGIEYREQLIKWAQEHANQCTALPS